MKNNQKIAYLSITAIILVIFSSINVAIEGAIIENFETNQKDELLLYKEI